jgi:hypothetical protein
MDEARSAKIANIKRAIAAGAYHVSAAEVITTGSADSGSAVPEETKSLLVDNRRDHKTTDAADITGTMARRRSPARCRRPVMCEEYEGCLQLPAEGQAFRASHAYRRRSDHVCSGQMVGHDA